MLFILILDMGSPEFAVQKHHFYANFDMDFKNEKDKDKDGNK